MAQSTDEPSSHLNWYSLKRGPVTLLVSPIGAQIGAQNSRGLKETFDYSSLIIQPAGSYLTP